MRQLWDGRITTSCGETTMRYSTYAKNMVTRTRMLRGHTFFDIKHLQIAWVANAASFHGGRVRKRPCISVSIEIFQVSAKKKYLSHACNAIIFTRVEPIPHWRVLQYHASGYRTSQTQAKCFYGFNRPIRLSRLSLIGIVYHWSSFNDITFVYPSQKL